MTHGPKFELRQVVEKWTGNYGGPGIVRGIANDDGQPLRYLVGHKIEGGFGEFYHVYAEGNLRERDALNDLLTITKEEGLASRTGQATPNEPTADEVRGILEPATPVRLQLTAQELNLVRQWFNAVEDVAPEYLTDADFELGQRVIEQVKRDEVATS